MKKVGVLCLSLVMCLSLGACSSGGDKKTESKKLVVYSPNSEGLIQAVIPLFQEKYDIEVDLQQAGTGELLKRLQNETNSPQADILFGGAHSQYIQNKDLFEPYVSQHDKEVVEAYQNKSGYTTSYVLDGSLLVYNKNLIGDIKIDSYEDLLNPALKGKIATADPASSSSAFAQLTNILLAKGGYENEEAWQYVDALFTNVDGKIQSGSSAVYKSVADGEMTVGLTYEDPAVTLLNDGAPIGVVYPSEGAVFLPATSGIIKNAKNIDNAKLFIDFLLTQEVQDIFGTSTTNRPVLKSVKTGETMKPLQDIRTLIEDADYINTNKDTLVQHYKEVFTSISSK